MPASSAGGRRTATANPEASTSCAPVPRSPMAGWASKTARWRAKRSGKAMSSASRRATSGARAIPSARLSERVSPSWLRGRSTRRRRSLTAARRSGVASSEASSITMSSRSGAVWVSTLITASRTQGAPLWTPMSTDTAGDVTGEPEGYAGPRERERRRSGGGAGSARASARDETVPRGRGRSGPVPGSSSPRHGGARSPLGGRAR